MAGVAIALRRLLPTFVVVLALSGLVTARRHVPASAAAALPSADTGGLPECPFHDGDTINVSVAQPIRHIPEYHDCQRLEVTTPLLGAYGPLVGIYASAALPSLTRDMSAVIVRPPGPDTGTPVGGAGNPSVPGGPGGAASAFGITVAHVLNLGTVAVGSLGIQSGHNCLYLYGDTASPRAFMRPVTDPDQCFERVGPDVAGAVALDVRVTRVSGFGHPDDYPPVARWETDRSRRTWIGIRCGTAWCSVGPRQSFFRRMWFWTATWGDERRPARMELDAAGSSRHQVRGWYDQQRLAHASGGGLVPRGAPMSVVPRADLGAIDDSMAFVDSTVAGDRWVEVATIYMDAPDSTYERKLNLLPGANRLAMRKRAGTWEARITPESGPARRFPVVRRDHSGHDIPATARWRWMKDDETIWTRCAAGCCEVQADQVAVAATGTGGANP